MVTFEDKKNVRPNENKNKKLYIIHIYIINSIKWLTKTKFIFHISTKNLFKINLYICFPQKINLKLFSSYN